MSKEMTEKKSEIVKGAYESVRKLFAVFIRCDN